MSITKLREGDFSLLVPDEPLLSPRRIFFGMLLWAWFIAIPEEPVYISFWRMVRFHRRPYAVHLWEVRRDSKRTDDAEGTDTDTWTLRPRLRAVSRWLLSHRLHGVLHGSGD